MHILFICTANIIRSFMAETVLREKLRRTGRQDITVSSAALIDMKGAAADPIAARIVLESGFDGTGHRSRLLTAGAVSGADWIVVMEKRHRDLIVRDYPEGESKIRLLKSYVRGYNEADSDIRDPRGMSVYHYRLCFSEIYLAVEAMLGAF
jgi:protein-tyrosine phosphatase